MQAFSASSNFPLQILRVKKEFVIDGVLYPVGAVRMWTSNELNAFHTRLGEHFKFFESKNLREHPFSEHFEIVEFK